MKKKLTRLVKLILLLQAILFVDETAHHDLFSWQFLVTSLAGGFFAFLFVIMSEATHERDE